MATQIASTPIIRGQQAVKIYHEANQKPNVASRIGVGILRNKFADKLKNMNSAGRD